MQRNWQSIITATPNTGLPGLNKSKEGKMDITITKVKNGYTVRPPYIHGTSISNHDILVFETIDNLINWLRTEDEKERKTK